VAHKVYDTPLLDKLGVRPAHKVVVLGVRDAGFLAQLRARAPDVGTRMRRGADVVFLAVEAPRDLARLAGIEAALARDGALWVVRPRGHAELGDEVLIAAAKRAGLVDNKICRFSDTHTAMRLVVPLARR
jgi:hypothetical protein